MSDAVGLQRETAPSAKNRTSEQDVDWVWD
jgi:hypothetical protein